MNYFDKVEVKFASKLPKQCAAVKEYCESRALDYSETSYKGGMLYVIEVDLYYDCIDLMKVLNQQGF